MRALLRGTRLQDPIAATSAMFVTRLRAQPTFDMDEEDIFPRKKEICLSGQQCRYFRQHLHNRRIDLRFQRITNMSLEIRNKVSFLTPSFPNSQLVTYVAIRQIVALAAVQFLRFPFRFRHHNATVNEPHLVVHTLAKPDQATVSLNGTTGRNFSRSMESCRRGRKATRNSKNLLLSTTLETSCWKR